MKKLFLALFILISSFTLANEGMWLPLLLDKLNEKEMRGMGMKISARDIYSVNSGSLKDAIVSFGGFCTGEVISEQGLVLTNHHCGFDAIQNHSTLDHNYIQDGFWAMQKNEEIPNPGLFVTFIVRIIDVTKAVLTGTNTSMSEAERQSQIDKNLNILRKSTKRESYQDVLIRPFFEGNQYFLFVTETYRDIRLVGAPPSSIGNYGKDTDNWIWPRHTGDFSMFRIYAGKDNLPADYSPDNKPYVPKKALSVSLDGVTEGDFTMVFGFPGRTNEYLYSEAVKQIMEVNDPAKIAIRTKALNVIDGYMRKDEQVKIQYAAKWAGISNAWKKWQGEVLGLTKTGAVGKKQAYEKEFQERVDKDPVYKEKYGNLLKQLQIAYDKLKPLGLSRDYFTEIVSKIELFTVARQLNSLAEAYNQGGKTAYDQNAPKIWQRLDNFYQEYSPLVDQKLFEALMEMYVKDQQPAYISAVAREQLEANEKRIDIWSSTLYTKSGLDNADKIEDLLNQPPEEFMAFIANDPAMILHNEILQTFQQTVRLYLNGTQDEVNALQREYMTAQMEVFKEKRFYPDANSTMRVTYGNVKGYEARDAVKYDYYTYLSGVMEKYKPGDYEFDLPRKLIDLYQKKDYGPYGEKGKQPVCFIATNHTTGGNSGSPVLDAYGNLVGLNFDRVWEGTMSDISYDPTICRNIMVDIRYVLFLVDKFAGAGHLVREMKLVHPKKTKQGVK